jgi:hypothetical protein
LNEAALIGEDDRLGAVVELELLEDSGDVGFDGGLAEDELAGDLTIRQAAGLAFTGSRRR